MDPSRADPVPWSWNDLKEILDHQLKGSLVSEVDGLAVATGLDVDSIRMIIDSSDCRTFGDVMQADVPGELLKIVKDFAKAALAREDTLPRDVARVLYVACLVRAHRAGLDDVTSLDASSVEREARRCLTFGWLPERIRQLLSGAGER